VEYWLSTARQYFGTTMASSRPKPDDVPAPEAGEGRGERRIRGLDAEQRKAQRREQLLAAALELFASEGYHSVSVDQICAAAYVSTKSFYADFESKEELFLVLYDQLFREAELAILTAVPPGGGGMLEPERTRRRIAAFIHACVDDPRKAKIGFLEAAGLSPAVEAHRRAAHHRFAAYNENTANPHVEDGTLIARDYKRGALGMVGAINEVLVDWVLDPDPDPVEVLIDQVTDVFLLIQRALEDPTVRLLIPSERD
jgi:AcrR family transcriptional regulator